MKKRIKEKAKQQFRKLHFVDETHTYTVEDKVLPSTSYKIKDFYEEFNKEVISKKYAKKHNLSQKEVLKRWEEINLTAIDNGTAVHNFAEDYCNGLKIKPFNKQCEAVISFWNNLPEYYELVFVELQMYSEDYWYAGTTDFVLLDKRNNSLVIGDYKTNDDLFSYYNYMLEPFEMLENNSFNHYQVQLSFYQILLEQLDYKISDRILVWLKKDGSYEVYHTSDFTNILKNSLNDNRRDYTKNTEYLF